tara:strand:+ start:124 stop:825 length:702 start_codon:yes stop_codon:yes gene_type:complete
MDNYYKLFEVSNDADISELRSAFRKKVKSCHPDLFQHVSPEERKNLQKKFVRLSQAYETLADPKKRELFDIRLAESCIRNQLKDKEHKKASNFSSQTENFKKYSSFSPKNYKSTSKESEDTLEDLIIDVEKILSKFDLNFKDPLEIFVDWAQEVYRDLTVTSDQQGEFNKDHAGLKNKSQNNNDPLQNIEEELQRLKEKREKTGSSNKCSKDYKISEDEIEQELRSIKKKYRL